MSCNVKQSMLYYIYGKANEQTKIIGGLKNDDEIYLMEL